jgi:phage gp29-like protein
MADPNGGFSLLRWARNLAGWSPRRGAPEDDAAPPSTDMVLTQSPEALMLVGPQSEAYLKTITANPDTILRREGYQDLSLFDRLLDDDVCMSNLQTRRLAIVSKDWVVEPGDPEDPRSVQAADDFRDMLKEVGFDRVTGLLHYTIWFGYGVAEFLWTTKVLDDGRRIIWIEDILVPDRRWFGFTLDGELRFIAAYASINGEALPPNKFLALRTGGTHDFAFYGLGLAHWAYWPVWFKRAGLKFWALALEKLSQPTAVGGFNANATDKEKRTLIDALTAIGRDTAVAVPEEYLKEDRLKIMETGRTAAGIGYSDFVDEQNEALMRIILGQPGTSKATPQGIGGKQAEVHDDVKDEIVKADSDLICEALNDTAARWVTRWNHGEQVKPPRVFRQLDDPEDLDTIADRDKKLKDLGIVRTEESIAEVYGEEYEKVEEPSLEEKARATAIEKGLAPIPGQRQPANDDDLAQARRAQFDVHDPAPLYIQRKVVNVAAIKAWAEAQGLTLVDDLHVTQLYSREPVDWFAMGEGWTYTGDEKGRMKVKPGGVRKVERFGDDSIVLAFKSDDLEYRHRSMIERGASHDFESYVPHITIAKDPDKAVDLDAIEPYIGEIVLGPELFEEIVEKPDAREIIGFSAEDEDAIERLTAALMDDANPAIREFAASISASLEGVTSLEGARVALLQAFERFPEERFAKAFGLPLVAMRAAAEAGVEDRIEA